MKKVLFSMALALMLVLMVSIVCYAQITRTITFQFEKVVLETDLDHFELEYSTDATFADPFDPLADPTGGTWQTFASIPRTGDETTYTHPEPLETPSNTETRYWFRINAVDGSGNPSGWCYGHDTEGVCTYLADNKSPGVLIQFKILSVVIES